MRAEGQPSVALLLDELVGAAVPDLHRAGAVLALRNLALERRILERVVLDVHGEPSRSGLQRQALRDRPAGERAVPLQPQVVVEPARVVALDDETRALVAPRHRRMARGFVPDRAFAGNR